jgi:uncharacterized protein (UPF0335 family)
LIEDLHIIQTKQNIFKQLSKTGTDMAVIRVVLEVHNHRNSQKNQRTSFLCIKSCFSKIEKKKRKEKKSLYIKP